MFFAESLGPVLTPLTVRELSTFLRRKLEGRKSVSPDQLREIVAEYMYIANIRTTADSVIDFMARAGAITFEGPSASASAKFELAA